jgi:hypothetical protein
MLSDQTDRRVKTCLLKEASAGVLAVKTLSLKSLNVPASLYNLLPSLNRFVALHSACDGGRASLYACRRH